MVLGWEPGQELEWEPGREPGWEPGWEPGQEPGREPGQEPGRQRCSPVGDELIGDGVVAVVIRSSFAGFHKQLHVGHFGLSLNAHIKSLQQLDLDWIGAGRHLVCKVGIGIDVESVTEAAEVGLSEDVVGVLEAEVAGDAEDFGEPAEEIDLDGLPSDYDLAGQLEGADLVHENDEVAFVLQFTPIKVASTTTDELKRSSDRNTDLGSGAAGVEGHGADNVSLVGREGTVVVSEPQVVHVDARHGVFLQGHHHLTG